MNRLGISVLAGMPPLSVDQVVERIEAVTAADVHGLAAVLLAPERLSAAGWAVTRTRFAERWSPWPPALMAAA